MRQGLHDFPTVAQPNTAFVKKKQLFVIAATIRRYSIG
jgi:hypothetical protein